MPSANLDRKMVILRINLQISCFMITKFVESFPPLQLSPFKLAISKSDKRYTYFLPLWREQTISTTPKFRHDDIFIQCFLFFWLFPLYPVSFIYAHIRLPVLFLKLFFIWRSIYLSICCYIHFSLCLFIPKPCK